MLKGHHDGDNPAHGYNMYLQKSVVAKIIKKQQFKSGDQLRKQNYRKVLFHYQSRFTFIKLYMRSAFATLIPKKSINKASGF